MKKNPEHSSMLFSDADLSEYGDPTRAEGGYKIQVSKCNSVFIQNLPLTCVQGVELSASVGTAEESRVSIRNPVCDGLCACFGVSYCVCFFLNLS